MALSEPARAWHRRAPLAVLLAGFAASRLAAAAAGMRFDTYPLGHFWQYIDPALLHDRLLESLWYLHSQPPLFNLLLGTVLKLPPAWQNAAFALFYHAAGLGLALTMFALMQRLGAGAWRATALTLVFACSPAALYFEHFLFIEYPAMLLLCGAALALHRWLRDVRWYDGCAACALMAAAIYTRSVFQWPWMAAVLGALIAVDPSHRRALLRAAAPALALVLALYLKNLMLFGSFATSSWLGMNLMAAVDFAWAPAERSALVEQGAVAPLLAVPAFSPVAAYAPLGLVPPPSGIAILDAPSLSSGKPNYGHAVYAVVSPLYGREALRLLATHPVRYAGAVAAAASLYFRPANDYEYFSGFRRRVPAWDALYRWTLYGQWTAGDRAAVAGPHGFSLAVSASRIGWLILFGTALLLWLGLRRLRAAHRAGDVAACGTLAYILITLAYLILVCTLLNIGENQRYRFMTEPLLFVLWGAAGRARPVSARAR